MKEENRRGKEEGRRTLGRLRNGTECAEENKNYVREITGIFRDKRNVDIILAIKQA